MKFGGTSVADADAVGRLISIVRNERAPVVVVSALAKVTDSLVNVARLAEDGEAQKATDSLRALLDRHLTVATAVTTASRDATLAAVRAEFDESIGLVHALAVLREVSPRSLERVTTL